MSRRAEQRDETRERIVAAAAEAFSELGYRGASTREIASRAGTNQGLITYHFRSKDELWKAAAEKIFGLLEARLMASLEGLDSEDPRDRAREGIREYVRFAAAHPEFFRLMVDEGNHDGERMQWLVDSHLRPLYQRLPQIGTAGTGALKPHAFYALVGAASVLFAVAPECRRLTGLDPGSDAAIETHADFVADLLVP